jgi:hypothetical protein
MLHDDSFNGSECNQGKHLGKPSYCFDFHLLFQISAHVLPQVSWFEKLPNCSQKMF